MARQLLCSLRYVFHVESALQLGVLALLLGMIERAALLPNTPAATAAALARILWATYFYLVLRRAAVGSRRLPALSDYRDSWDTLILPLIQASLVGLWYWGPMLIAAHYSVGLSAFSRQLQLSSLAFFRQPHVVSLVILGVEMLYLPAALVASATTGGLWRLLDPTCGLRLVSRVPRAYLATFAALQILVALAFLSSTASALMQQLLPIPLAGPVLGHLLTLWVPLAQARLLGDFVHAHHETLTAGRSPG